jgi:hypothetical protein
VALRWGGIRSNREKARVGIFVTNCERYENSGLS